MKNKLLHFIILLIIVFPFKVNALDLQISEVVTQANLLFEDEGWNFTELGATGYYVILAEYNEETIATYTTRENYLNILCFDSLYESTSIMDDFTESSEYTLTTSANRMLLYTVLTLYYGEFDYELMDYIYYDTLTLEDNGIFVTSEYTGSKTNSYYDTEFIIDISNINIDNYMESLENSISVSLSDVELNFYNTSFYSQNALEDMDISILESGGSGFNALLFYSENTYLFSLSNQYSYYYVTSLSSLTEDDLEIYSKAIETIIFSVLESAYPSVYQFDGSYEFDYTQLSLEENGISYNIELKSDGTYDIELSLALERINLDSDIDYFIALEDDSFSITDVEDNEYIYYIAAGGVSLIVISIGLYFAFKNKTTKINYEKNPR